MASTHEIIYLRSTHGDPIVRAQAALAERGDEMLAELSAKVALAVEYDLSPASREELQDRLVAFCGDRVLRYLLAVDRVLYTPAAAATKTRLLVRGLRAQHQAIAGYIEDLDRASSREALTAAAYSVVAALTCCREAERTALLPALATLPGVDLPTLIDRALTLLDGNVPDRGEVGTPVR